jgi:uncharacterized membrane protein YkoI
MEPLRTLAPLVSPLRVVRDNVGTNRVQNLNKEESLMDARKMTAAFLLAAAALAPGFVFVGPAAAQEQTKEKSGHKGQAMTMDQLPQPVRQTINQEAKGGTVGKIKQETSRGKTYYMAEVTDTNGKKHHVRVNEDGTLMSGRSARSSKSSTETTTNTTK